VKHAGTMPAECQPCPKSSLPSTGSSRKVLQRHGIHRGSSWATPVRQWTRWRSVTKSPTPCSTASKPNTPGWLSPITRSCSSRRRVLISGRSPTGRAWRLARAGVSLAVAHTSFDSAGGTGEALAAALGLSDVRVFGPTGPAASAKVVTFLPWESVEPVTEAMAEAGGGRIGNYTGCSFRVEGVGAFEASTDPYAGTRGENRVQEYRVEMIVPRHRVGPVTAALVTAHPYEEPAYDIYEVTSNGRFIGRVGQFEGSFDELVAVTSEVTGSDGMRVTRASDRASTVAVVPGSGSSFISAARSAGADVFVTGDVDHHRVVEARDGGMSIIDPGHAPTERPGMAALVDAVRTAVPEVGVVDLTGFDPTPWR
jgi:putative NIF3 family GTP cyclohydrolase 1 type 2